MAVKAVFYVQRVTDTASGAGEIVATPVAKGPYAEYSKWTPTGELKITSLNPDATKWFRDRIGKDVSILIDDTTEDDVAPQ